MEFHAGFLIREALRDHRPRRMDMNRDGDSGRIGRKPPCPAKPAGGGISPEGGAILARHASIGSSRIRRPMRREIPFPPRSRTVTMSNSTETRRKQSGPSALTETLSTTTGHFLVLEGPDGGGKSTQAARLASWLASGGREVVACREPGGTELGERLRSIVLERSRPGHRDGGRRCSSTWPAAPSSSRRFIRPALGRGAVVVCDRFLLSNVVYQGYAGGPRRGGSLASRPDGRRGGCCPI